MNLILMWSRRRRRRRPTSPRCRHDQARVYAPRERAVAVPRRRRLRRAGRRLHARARRTVASTSTRKPPASRSSTHGYVLTTSARCGTRAWLVDWERHAPTSYGPRVVATGGCSCEESGLQWRNSGCIGSRVRFRRRRRHRCECESLRRRSRGPPATAASEKGRRRGGLPPNSSASKRGIGTRSRHGDRVTTSPRSGDSCCRRRRTATSGPGDPAGPREELGRLPPATASKTMRGV